MNPRNFQIFSAFLFVVSLLILAQTAKAQLTIDNKNLVTTLYQNSNETGYFNITSNETINNVSFNALNLPTGVTIVFSPNSVNLTANVSQKIDFTVTAQQNAQLGRNTITINANSTASASFSFDLTVKRNYCQNGPRGQIKIDVSNPDDGDDFYAGDNISIELNVENNINDDIDVVIEAELFDLTTGETIEDISFDDSLDEDEDKDYEFGLEVPSDIDINDDYVLNVKAYEDGNEEDQCKEDSINLDLKKRTHELIIKKVSYASVFACGETFDLTVKVENAGTKDEQDAIVTIYSYDLNISLEKTKDIDKEDTESFYFTDIMPMVPPGKYLLEIKVESDNADDFETIEIELRDNCKEGKEDVSILVSQQNVANINQDTIYKATITNTGSSVETYAITAQNYQTWATLSSLTPNIITLNPGQSQDIIIIIKPNQNAASLNTFQIQASSDGNQIKTENIMLSLSLSSEEKQQNFFEQLKEAIKKDAWLFIINAILILIIIGLIILVAMKPKTREKKENSEPKEVRLKKRKS